MTIIKREIKKGKLRGGNFEQNGTGTETKLSLPWSKTEGKELTALGFEGGGVGSNQNTAVGSEGLPAFLPIKS